LVVCTVSDGEKRYSTRLILCQADECAITHDIYVGEDSQLFDGDFFYDNNSVSTLRVWRYTDTSNIDTDPITVASDYLSSYWDNAVTRQYLDINIIHETDYVLKELNALTSQIPYTNLANGFIGLIAADGERFGDIEKEE